MALITCPECGKQVSDAAPACVGCGRPFAQGYAAPVAKKGMSVALIILIAVLGVSVLGAVVLVAAGAGFAFMVTGKHQEAMTARAKVDARTIHPAAEKYRIDHPSGACPTVETLRQEKEISELTSLTDPWGGPSTILCKGDVITVLSLGPDKKLGTADDILIPEEK